MKIIKANSILGIIGKLVAERKEKIYLVGGYIRDFLLRRATYDMDFAIDGSAKKFSTALAEKMRAKSFALDEETQTFRIVFSGKTCSERWNIDISKMQGKDITADLKRRDFSINAMAVDLMKLESLRVREPGSLDLIDPFNGLKDLKKGIIRVVSSGALNEDPLRLLRAFRFAATLGFKIENKTLKAISVRSSLIRKASRERIRDEFFKILSVNNSCEYVSRIDKAGLLKKVIPQINKIKQESGLWKHSMLTLGFLETIIKKKYIGRIWSGVIYEKADNHLGSGISIQSTRGVLLKFVSLLHDIGKPPTKKIRKGKISFIGHEKVGGEIIGKIAEDLRLSNKEIKIILKIVGYHMRVHYLVNLDSVTNRAIARIIRDADEETIELLLFTLADFMATPADLKNQTLKRNQEITKEIIGQYFKFKESKKFVRIITGDDLIKKFKMKEGPEIGRILEEAELVQREGKIHTRREALSLVSGLLSKPHSPV
jgi:poly(A) polymerase